VAARPLQNQDHSSSTTDNLTALRLQRLRLLGIIGQGAMLLSDLAWGEPA
jgi:hypothetical protein